MHSAREKIHTAFVPFTLYLIFFFALWAFSRIMLIPWLEHQQIGATDAVETIWKFLVFVVPVLLYLSLIDHVKPLAYLRLTSQLKQGLIWGIIGCLPSLVILLSYLFSHHFILQPQKTNIWENIIFVGITEEIPFRGFLLQKLEPVLGFWPASILASLLFVLIHVPEWLEMGQTSPAFWLRSTIGLFIVGWLLCLLLRQSRSLWSCVIAHSFYNLVNVLL